ncbi:MAG: 4Fe-4S dicluster domain-containing protein [Planctomycetaceae bacterium]|nr:4Fe-4S dicluster domain-containing protein [Planctomycetaceae bacterium]
MSLTITRPQLNQLIAGKIAAGTAVAGPVAAGKRFFFKPLKNAEELVLDGNIMPTNSIKEFFFPKHEAICKYRYEGKELVVEDVPDFNTEQIVFGARPCDGASLPILDKVFAWDYQDRFYQQRRAKTTIVTLACQKADEMCFCTSVGFAPDTNSGADAMLLDVSGGTCSVFEVRIFTDKGKALFDGKTTEDDKTGKTATPPPVRFDAERVKTYLSEHFDDPVYAETSLRCVGCGACTYICPTCHCFDIVDEGGAAKGSRVKNWDTCQFALFTLHASGHNPRANQAVRQRNRVQHKFAIYPNKFGVILCTGCGNCTRDCSASLGIRPVLEHIDKKAQAQ